MASTPLPRAAASPTANRRTAIRRLPGDANGTFHTRFRSPRLDGSTIYFAADDANTSNPNFKGIFSVPTGGGAFTNIVDTTDTLPGLTTINSNSFESYSASGGMLAFTAVDGLDHYGLYAHTGSTTTKVLATGDGGPFADLHAASYAPSIGSQAVDGGGILLFAGVRFSANGIYLATPLAASADLASTLSASANASLGSDTTLDVSVMNNGPATATTISLVVTLPPGLTFKSAVGGTFDAGGNTVTFSVASLASGASKAFSIVATVDVTGPLTASAYASSARADSNLMNNHAFATANTIFASTGNWVVRKIVDNFTPVPDKAGVNFVIGGGIDPLPALDGGKVAFVAFDASNAASVWSANADGSGGFTRLVGTNTSVPGGAGEKFGYMKNVRLRNGTVVFLGYGASQLHDGFYSVPVEGGTVKSVATTETVRPGGNGAKFGYQDFIQNFSLGYMGDGKMSFVAQSGLYVFPVAGGDGAVVVYPGSNIPMADFAGAGFAYAPAISGTRVVWEGTGGRDALFGSFLDHRHFHALADIATESPSTPGQNFVLSTQGSFADAQVEGKTVVFKAFSGTGASIRGIYGVTGQSAIVKLVDTNTDVPGGNGKFIAFTSAGSPDTFALSDGEVVFLGVDEDNRAGLYSVAATGGAITKIVAVGDMIGNLVITGTTGFFQPPMQPNGLGAHQVAFRADYFDTVTNKASPAIFVASRVMNRLANISTRLSVGTDDNVLIGGLIINGTLPKKVIARAIGPSLPLAGALADPTLELHDGSGALIASNDNWMDAPNKQEIIDSTIPPTNALESAIVATLDPGFYTAIVRGKNNSTGNGLVEVYDLEPSTDLATRLVNISTRGFVQTGDAVMIGGVIVQGGAEKHLLVRGIGPSLADAGVANALLDPTLDLVDGGGTVVATNDNWRDTQEQAIIDSTVPPTDNRESAVDVHLMPGAYTAILRGRNDTTGNALVEVYELP